MERENFHSIKNNLRNSKKYPLTKGILYKNKKQQQAENAQKILSFNCDQEGHENMQAGIICMDPNCRTDRLLCFKCYHERHLQHCCMTVNDFQQNLHCFLSEHENIQKEKSLNLSQSKLIVQRMELTANLQRKFNLFVKFFQTATSMQQKKLNELVPLDAISTVTQSKTLRELKKKIEKILNQSDLSFVPDSKTAQNQIVNEYMITQFKQFDNECQEMEKQNEQLSEIMNNEFHKLFEKIGKILNQEYEESKIDSNVNLEEVSKNALELNISNIDALEQKQSSCKKTQQKPRKYKKRIRFSRSPQSNQKVKQTQAKSESGLLSNGIKEFQQGSFQQAKESITHYLEIMNKTSSQENEILKAKSHYYLGYIEKKLHSFDDSVINLRTAFKKYKKFLGNEATEVADTYFMLGNAYKKLNNFKEATSYHQKALDIRNQLQRQDLVAESYFQLGKIKIRKGELQEGLKNHEKALSQLTEINDGNLKLLVELNLWLGIDNFQLQCIDAALRYLNNAVKLQENNEKQLHNLVLLGLPFYWIGLVYQSVQKFEESIEMLLKAQTIFEKKQHLNQITNIIVYTKIARVYKDMKMFNIALNYYQKLDQIIDKASMNQMELAEIYIDFGICLNKLQQYHNAIFYLSNSMKLYQNHGKQQIQLVPNRFSINFLCDSKSVKIQGIIALGEAFFAVGKFNEAEKIVNQAKLLSSDCKDKGQQNQINQLLLEIQEKLQKL